MVFFVRKNDHSLLKPFPYSSMTVIKMPQEFIRKRVNVSLLVFSCHNVDSARRISHGVINDSAPDF
jgi:hypothetical protein